MPTRASLLLMSTLSLAFLPRCGPHDGGGTGGSGGTTASTSSSSSVSGTGGATSGTGGATSGMGGSATASSSSGTGGSSGSGGGASTSSSSSGGTGGSTGGSALWSKRFGGTPNEGSRRVRTDAAGNVLYLGNFGSTIDLGGGPLTGPGDFLAKLDGAGNHLWSKAVGAGTSFNSNGAIAVDGTGALLYARVIAGTVDLGGGPITASTPKLLVAKLDAAGNLVWSRLFDNGAYTTSIAVNAANEVLLSVTGDCSSTGGFSFGGSPISCLGTVAQAVLVKLDATGNHVWSKAIGASMHFGGDSSNGGLAAFDAAGRIYLGVAFDGAFDFGGGTFDSTTGAGKRAVIALDGNGSHLWSKQIQGDFRVLSSNRLILAGSFTGTIDLGGGPLVDAAASGLPQSYVAALDTSGHHVWSKKLGQDQTISAYDVAVDAADKLHLTGNFYGPVDFGGGAVDPDAGSTHGFALELDADGNYVWGRGFAGDALLSGIAVDPSGNTFLAGSFSGDTDFGDGVLTSAGGSDAVLAKLAP